MAGVPDYELYIAHRRAHHPAERPSLFKSVEAGGAVMERFLMTVSASLTLATLAAVVYVLLILVR